MAKGMPKDFAELTDAANKAYAAWRKKYADCPFPPIETLSDLEYALYGMCACVMAYRKGEYALTLDELCEYVLALYGYAMTERG